MAIIDYKDGIYKDTNICDGEAVYFGKGQGCSTIYFKSVGDAKKFIDRYGYIAGFNSGLCEKCKCHYSYGSEKWEKAIDYACREWEKQLKAEIGLFKGEEIIQDKELKDDV